MSVMQIPEVVIINDDEGQPSDDFMTNGETCSPQRPLIVVSPGSPHPSYLKEREIPRNDSVDSLSPSEIPRNDSFDCLSPREKNISFWRSNSKDSSFSTMDEDDDDESEELARLVDQVKVASIKLKYCHTALI